MSASTFTPPPSTQLPKNGVSQHREDTSSDAPARLASPPTTTRPAPRARTEFRNGQLPTLEEVRDVPDSQLRNLVLELIPAVGESRMALAHTKLQLNLLSIETAEWSQRAEAEHDLTRREVEVLQAGSPILRHRTALNPDPRSPLAQVQRHLESSIKQGRDLETENFALQRRLKQAKKVIKHLDGKSSQLLEDNQLLRERIRQNRAHFNEFRAFTYQDYTPPLSAQAPPQRTKIADNISAHPNNQNPLDALLMAAQRYPLSVPSTPTPNRANRYNHTHTRGTHSMSSLPSTPSRSRPMTAEELLRTPVNQIIPTSHVNFSTPATQTTILSQNRVQEDRDSTISASDDEVLTDEDIPASQASQAASSLLRRYAGPNSQDSAKMSNQERMVQTKLTGKVSKQKGTKEKAVDRYDDVDDADGGNRLRKRARTNDMRSQEQVGLGIGLWPSPRR